MNAIVNRRHFVRATLAVGAALAGVQARAAAGRVYYGYPPGSIGAKVAGIVLKEIQGVYRPELGLELNYMPGNSGARSLDAARSGAADGSTVLYSPSTVLTLLSHVRTLPGMDPAAEFTPVAPLVEFTFAFTVGPAVPSEVRTMKDYVLWVRENPLLGGYGLPGLGTAPHFVGMSLARTANIPIKAVAYQGLNPMTKDLLDGAVPAAIAVLGGLSEPLASGKLRALAVTCAQRWPAMRELPTLRELGLCDVDVTETFGFHVPSATPRSKVDELHTAVQRGVRGAALTGLFSASLLRAVLTTPDLYADALARERAAWRDIVKRERFTLQS